MRRPCVRVKREIGEVTRRELEAQDALDYEAAIDSDDEFVYIPVRAPPTLADEYDIVQREVEPRDSHTMPEDLLEFSPTYERLGDLILLQEADPDRAKVAADAFLQSDLPVTAVLNRESDVTGTYRVADWELLAGNHTETIHREYGAEFLVDPTEVYFSPRLATERQRVIDQVEAGEHLIDMFAGVGPYAIRAAMAGAEVVAADINPEAVKYCRENARRNDVENRVTIIEGDVSELANDYTGWADRLIMNLPHSAQEHLQVAAQLAGESCRLHYYDIRPEAEAFDGEAVIRSVFEPDYHVDIAARHRVRSYAPGVVNICLDADVGAE